jgi:branched-chain amino acid transport system permease protein
MRKFLPRRVRYLTLGILISLLIPLVVHSSFILHVLVMLGIYIVLSDSNNFVLGFAGQCAIGHAAFVAIGGYAGALIILNTGFGFWWALLGGGIVAYASGLILGLLAMRLRGDYLGLVTVAFGEIVRQLATNLHKITRGPMGLPGIDRPQIFGYRFSGEVPYYYLIIAMVVVTHWVIERLLFSRFGRACLALREDEVAAEAMGVQSYRYKVLSFCISSGMAGLAGVFYASWTTIFSPDAWTLNDSINISVMVTLGGIGSLLGAIPGAIGIGALPELLRPFTSGTRWASLRLSGVGLILVLLLIVRPQGLLGTSLNKGYLSLEGLWRRLRLWPANHQASIEGEDND